MKNIGGWWLPDHEQHMLPHFESGKGFQVDRLEDILRFVPERKAAVDCGAHVGSWTVRMAREFNAVLAFEPAPDAYECLMANTRHLKNVATINGAVSDRREQLWLADDMKWEGNTGGRHAVAREAGIWPDPVEATALDLIGLDGIDFIKLDVEGMEAKALRGAHKSLQAFRPVVCLEMKPRLAVRYGAPDEAERVLREIGYVPIHHVGADWVWRFRAN